MVPLLDLNSNTQMIEEGDGLGIRTRILTKIINDLRGSDRLTNRTSPTSSTTPIRTPDLGNKTDQTCTLKRRCLRGIDLFIYEGVPTFL